MNVNQNKGTGATVTFGATGTEQTLTGWNQSIGVSGNSNDYVGYKLVGSAAIAGSIAYTSSLNPVVTDGQGNAQSANWNRNYANSKSHIAITQSGDPALYLEEGLINSRKRPVYTTSDGTTYWEVIKWETI